MGIKDFANVTTVELVSEMNDDYVTFENFDAIPADVHEEILGLIHSLTCAVDNSRRGWPKFFNASNVNDPHRPRFAGASDRGHAYAKLVKDDDFATTRLDQAMMELHRAKIAARNAKKSLVRFYAAYNNRKDFTFNAD